MGACSVNIDFPASDTKALFQAVASQTEQMRNEEGDHAYSGTWAAKACGVDFPAGERVLSMNAAEELLMDNDKWDCVWAVKVQGAYQDHREKLKLPKKAEAIQAKIKVANEKLDECSRKLGCQYNLHSVLSIGQDPTQPAKVNFEAKPLLQGFLETIKGQAAKLKTCQTCGSKIAKDHLSTPYCPVCKDRYGFASETQVSQSIRAAEKVCKAFNQKRSLEVQLNEIKEKARREALGSDWHWYVGGLCPC